MHYKLEYGKYRRDGSKLYVQEATRYLLNKHLDNLLAQDAAESLGEQRLSGAGGGSGGGEDGGEDGDARGGGGRRGGGGGGDGDEAGDGGEEVEGDGDGDDGAAPY